MGGSGTGAWLVACGLAWLAGVAMQLHERELLAVSPSRRCSAAERWSWDGVDFAVLRPDASDHAKNLKSNAMTCALRVPRRRAQRAPHRRHRM